MCSSHSHLLCCRLPGTMSRHLHKIELANGRNKSSRRPGSKQIAVLKNFIHTVCQKMLPAMYISHSGMASHSATFIDQSHPMFCTNCTKEFLSIWLIGARESSLLRNLRIRALPPAYGLRQFKNG